MKVECVLFDLDGVLVNACEWPYDALVSLKSNIECFVERYGS